MEAMMEAEVEIDDIECKDGQINLFAPATEFYKAKQAFQEAFPDIELDVQEITFLPQSSSQITADDLPMFEKFIQMLNDCEDVQDIYHNAILPD